VSGLLHTSSERLRALRSVSLRVEASSDERCDERLCSALQQCGQLCSLLLFDTTAVTTTSVGSNNDYDFFVHVVRALCSAPALLRLSLHCANALRCSALCAALLSSPPPPRLCRLSLLVISSSSWPAVLDFAARLSALSSLHILSCDASAVDALVVWLPLHAHRIRCLQIAAQVYSVVPNADALVACIHVMPKLRALQLPRTVSCKAFVDLLNDGHLRGLQMLHVDFAARIAVASYATEVLRAIVENTRLERLSLRLPPPPKVCFNSADWAIDWQRNGSSKETGKRETSRATDPQQILKGTFARLWPMQVG
jgi:hypothetical protein